MEEWPTFNFSRWKAGVIRRLRLAHLCPSNVDTPNCRRSTRGFNGGFTKSPFLSANINLINSGSAIISLGLVSIQPRDTFPEKLTLESVSTFQSLKNSGKYWKFGTLLVFYHYHFQNKLFPWWLSRISLNNIFSNFSLQKK